MTYPSRRRGTHISSIGHCIRVNNRIIFTLLSFNPSNKNIDNHYFVFLSGLESQIVFLFLDLKSCRTPLSTWGDSKSFLSTFSSFDFSNYFSIFFSSISHVISLFAVSFLFNTESSSIVDDAVIGNHLDSFVVVANVVHRWRFASYDFAVWLCWWGLWWREGSQSVCCLSVMEMVVVKTRGGHWRRVDPELPLERWCRRLPPFLWVEDVGQGFECDGPVTATISADSPTQLGTSAGVVQTVEHRVVQVVLGGEVPRVHWIWGCCCCCGWGCWPRRP